MEPRTPVSEDAVAAVTKRAGAPALLTVAARDEERLNRAPLSLKLYQRMFGYTRNYRRVLTLLLGCVTLRALQLPLLSLAFSSVLNGPINARNVRGLILGTLGYVALALFTQFTFFHRMHGSLLLGEGVVHDLREDLFGHIQRLTMGFFNRTRVGRVISRFTSDAEALRAGIQDAVFGGLVAGGQLVLALAIMAWCDHALFLVVLATAPVYYLVYHYFRGKLSYTNRVVQESYSRLTATVAESVTGVRVTQGFVRQDANAQLWRGLVVDHANYNMAVSRVAGSFNPLLELTSAVMIALLFVIGGYRILHHPGPGGPTVKELTVFFFLVGNVLDPVAMLGSLYVIAANSMAGAERVFRMLDQQPEFADPPDAAPLDHIRGRVEFRDLSFGYLPHTPVLKHITFTVEPAQTVALVGHTGSGKSSIINLISKFYLPDSGQLLIDGVDTRRVCSKSLHAQMGIVLQQNFLFTGAVMENIRLGKPFSDQQVVDAVAKLDVMDMFESLPQGLQTVVGERGGGLSLGQRQLVCFARAMLADPKILILDEATSSIDTLTEARIQKALAILLRGRTSFVVAHRLSTIRQADLILVLDHGQIIERGQHADLLADGGAYSKLYQQFIEATQA